MTTPEAKSWSDVSELVLDVAPAAHTILDKVAKRIGKSNAVVFEVTIPYGGMILDNGRFVYRDALGATASPWHELPLGLVVRGSAEVFLPAGTAGHPFPLRVLRSGEFFGVWEALMRVSGAVTADAPAPWSMTSGARTLYIVAPMDRLSFRGALAARMLESNDEHLARLGSTLAADNQIRRQADRKLSPSMFAWELVRTLGAEEAWSSTLLLFPDTWLLRRENKVVLELLLFLQDLRWDQSELLREEGRLLMEIGGCCAGKGSLAGAADVTTPTVLTIIENVYRQRAFAFALTEAPVVETDQALGPLNRAASELSEMLDEARVDSRPLFAVLTTDDLRPRYIPLGLPILRMPKKPDRGWPAYFHDLGKFLKACGSDLDGIFSTPPGVIDFLVHQPSNLAAKAKIWKEDLPTNHGRLVAVDSAAIGSMFSELGGTLNVRSRFFLGCVRIAARSEGEPQRA